MRVSETRNDFFLFHLKNYYSAQTILSRRHHQLIQKHHPHILIFTCHLYDSYFSLPQTTKSVQLNIPPLLAVYFNLLMAVS